MNITHRSRSLRRVIVGGITTAILAGSTIAFAGEAAAQRPRETTNTPACTVANAVAAYRWEVYASHNPSRPGDYEAYLDAKAAAFRICH